MANMPNNPNQQSHKSTQTDTSLNESITGGGTGYWGLLPIVVTSNSHPVASRADGALYDTTSGAYVAIQNTNIGTTAMPKHGQ